MNESYRSAARWKYVQSRLVYRNASAFACSENELENSFLVVHNRRAHRNNCITSCTPRFVHRVRRSNGQLQVIVINISVCFSSERTHTGSIRVIIITCTALHNIVQVQVQSAPSTVVAQCNCIGTRWRILHFILIRIAPAQYVRRACIMRLGR